MGKRAAAVAASLLLLPILAVPTAGEYAQDSSRLALAGEVVPVIVSEPVQPEPVVETYTITAYCSCRTCCGVWADNRPGGVVYTASGAVARQGVTVAADPGVLPMGTVIEIDGLGQRVVQDTGSAIKGYKLDLYFADHDAALAWGRQERTVTIVKGASV